MRGSYTVITWLVGAAVLYIRDNHDGRVACVRRHSTPLYHHSCTHSIYAGKLDINLKKIGAHINNYVLRHRVNVDRLCLHRKLLNNNVIVVYVDIEWRKEFLYVKNRIEGLFVSKPRDSGIYRPDGMPITSFPVSTSFALPNGHGSMGRGFVVWWNLASILTRGLQPILDRSFFCQPSMYGLVCVHVYDLSLRLDYTRIFFAERTPPTFYQIRVPRGIHFDAGPSGLIERHLDGGTRKIRACTRPPGPRRLLTTHSLHRLPYRLETFSFSREVVRQKFGTPSGLKK